MTITAKATPGKTLLTPSDHTLITNPDTIEADAGAEQLVLFDQRQIAILVGKPVR